MNITELDNLKLAKYIKKKISIFQNSKEYSEMIEGEKYYKGEQLIDYKERLAMDDNGKLKQIRNAPNTIIKNNQYARLVDQKVNYILSKKPTVEHKNENYKKELENFFDMRLLRTLNKTGERAFNNAIAWWYVYLSTDGQRLEYKLLNSKEIIPIWKDDNQESLMAIIRTKIKSEWDDKKEDFINREYAEFYTDEKCKVFKKYGDTYILENELAYISEKDEDGESKHLTWSKMPFIYFKYNSLNITLLSRVKSIQDAINTIISNFSDNMLEDSRNTILVLKGYEAEDGVRAQMNNTGVIHVDAGDDMGTPQGSVDTINIEVNAENYKSILETLKEMLIENGKGLDAKSNRTTQAPNEVNIKSMYTDIELDANKMELEFQASFEYLQWFFRKAHNIDEKMDPATITFKRNIMINEETIVNILRNSTGIISKETMVANHPYVIDSTEEIKRLEKEKEELPTGYPIDLFNIREGQNNDIKQKTETTTS